MPSYIGGVFERTPLIDKDTPFDSTFPSHVTNDETGLTNIIRMAWLMGAPHFVVVALALKVVIRIEVFHDKASY